MSADRVGGHEYRRDIDGLRAVAVLAVVAFHAFPTIFPGGFVGVDVFFVISGFLITGILQSAHRAGSFSFLGFYARRIRRIFPALIIVLLTSAALGWRIMVPTDFARLGRHMLAGAGFASNLVLWREAGYFDALSHEKPLLHLWSLGIEEQFYLVWPPLLWLFWRLRLPVLLSLAFLTAASFAANIALTASDLTAAFYSPLSRAWELGAGGLLACLQSNGKFLRANRFGGASTLLGLALIASAFVMTTPERHFPGWWALLPVLGACLVISGAPQSIPNRWALSNRVMVWVGLCSYPLYLWHWMLLSFARLAARETPSVNMRLGLVALSFVLAGLTYVLVERPIRFGRFRFREVGLAASLAGLGATGAGINAWGGLAARFPERARALLAYKYDFMTDAHSGECWITVRDPPEAYARTCFQSSGDHRPSIFIWGDSHAGRLRPGFDRVFGRKWAIGSAARNSTPPGRRTANDDYVLSMITQTRPDIVIIFADWSEYAPTDLLATTNRIAAAGIARTIVLGSAPIWNGKLPTLVYTAWHQGSPLEPLPRRMSTGLKRTAFDRDEQMRRLPWRDRVEFVSLIDMLCNGAGCYTYVPGSESDLMTWDYGHFTTAGAAYVVRQLHLAEPG